MWLGSIEHVLPECLGGVESLEIIRVRIANRLEQPGSKVRYLVVGRNPEEGRKGAKIGNFSSILKSGRMTVNGRRFDRETESLLREIDDLQKSCEIGWCIGAHNARAPVERLDRGEVCR